MVEETGAAVTQFRKGDHVLISCISSCGKCENCRRRMYSHCSSGGWILGNTIDGTQAEYVRIPHADTSLYAIPSGSDEEALVMLSDILPTGFECGVLNGKVEPGGTVAIVGVGPVGLAALLTAQLYSPGILIAIDLDDNRLEIAKAFGATYTINAGSGVVTQRIMELTGGKGVDTAIEAVGIPATFELCEELVAVGGVIANVGVHGVKADLHLETLWSKNIAITTRLVDTVTTPTLLKIVQSGRINPDRLITHRFAMESILDAYDTFSRASDTRALKVIIRMAEGDAATKGSDEQPIRVTTSKGLHLVVRTVRPDDERLLAEFFRHLTPQDMRFRFLSGMSEVSHAQISRMTHVDHRLTENFLAFADEGRTLVASAMLGGDDDLQTAEVAVAVHAEYRHEGIGWELLRQVAAYAKDRGIKVLQSIESRENHDAIELERQQGFTARPYPDDATLVLIQKELQN